MALEEEEEEGMGWWMGEIGFNLLGSVVCVRRGKVA